MNKLTFLADAESEMLGGGRGFTLGSYNNTFTNLVGIDQSMLGVALADRGGRAGNLQTQIAGILNVPVIV